MNLIEGLEEMRKKFPNLPVMTDERRWFHPHDRTYSHQFTAAVVKGTLCGNCERDTLEQAVAECMLPEKEEA